MKWVKDRADAPLSYISWTSLYTLSVVCERNFITHFEGWNVTPNLFVLLVGPPGMRKTTVMENFSSELLSRVDGLAQGPDFFTKEQLMRMLIEVKSSVFLLVGEFSDLLQKNKADIYEFLITCYDSKKRLVEGTRMRGNETVEKPCVNMMAATTPGWITTNMSAGIIHGGFASRCLWIFEDTKRISKLFPVQTQTPEEIQQLEDDLVHDLNHIATLKGTFRFLRGYEYNNQFDSTRAYGDRDDTEWLEAWYLELQTEQTADAPNDHIKLYRVRKHVQIIKIAMLHSVSQRDDLVLLKEDVEFGKRAVESTEKKLMRVFGGMGRNPYTEDVNKIVDWVIERTGQGSPIPEDELYRKYQNSATPRMLDELVAGLVRNKELQLKPKGGTNYVFPGEAVFLRAQPIDERVLQ